MDALDQYGRWHIAIVMSEEKHGGNWAKRIHFEPFKKANRDEIFQEEDSTRIAPVFTNADMKPDPLTMFEQLREYLRQNSTQQPKKVEEKKGIVPTKPTQLRQTRQKQESVKRTESPNSEAISRQREDEDMIAASYLNMPMPYDQAAVSPSIPFPLKEENFFPTVPMYDRRENFEKFDEETLFFAFYFQPGTY